jgi:SAM-dependent methyltransferase
VRLSSYDGELFVHSAFPTDAPDSVFFGPDTYRMADAAAACTSSRSVKRAVDIGCGTGAGAITVAKRAPGAEVLAVDINDNALRYARINAALAGSVGARAVEHGRVEEGGVAPGQRQLHAMGVEIAGEFGLVEGDVAGRSPALPAAGQNSTA